PGAVVDSQLRVL
ncbi:unnamed protein product, partial [Allacma fusca]